MSTWLYLECLDHDPPLRADDESGQHLYDLPQIRADVADRDALVAAVRATEFGDEIEAVTDGYFRRRTLRFLVAHPTCHIGIRDEYGRAYPLDAEADLTNGAGA